MARNRKAEGRTNRGALVASGRKVDTSSEAEAQRKKRQAQGWQPDAWRFYNEIGEIGEAYDNMGDALRRARLVIAEADEETGAPNILEPSEAPEEWDALERVKAASGGQGAILANLSVCLGVVGEGYVVGWKNGDGDEEWDAFSADQVVAQEKDWYLASTPGQQIDSMTKLDADAFICRIWKRHPQWRDYANSAMRRLIAPCDELLILSRAIRGSAVSRLAGAGMLLMPEEVSFGSADPTEGEATTDPFTDDLMAVMMTPIEDPTSAAAIVPYVVTMPGDQINNVKYLTFDRPIDAEQAKQRGELLGRIWNGLDMPNEVLNGGADSNHWNAWLASDEGQDRLESLLTLICDGLTSGYFRAVLPDSERFIWFDNSEMVKHPNLAADAEDALAAGAIGYPPYRRAKGFDESDAMSDEDFDHWQAVQAAKHAAKPALGEPAVDSTTVDQAPPEQPETDPALDDTPITASARDRLPIGGELLDLERAVRNRLLVAADAEMTRTIERVGASMRRRAQRNDTLRAAIDGVDNLLVPQALGRSVVKQWGDTFTDHAVLDGAFLALYPKWEGWTSQAQRRVAVIANREGADIGPDEYVAQHEQDRLDGWQAFVAALTTTAALRLYDPRPEVPNIGEADLVSSIPVGIVRGALSRAGGSHGTINTNGSMTVTDAQGRTTAAPGLTTGPDAMTALSQAGLTPTGFLWSTGGPDRPFEPHQDLEGLEFANFGDEALAADPGDFPFVSVYAPGDHPGCACDAAPILEATAVEIPAAEEAA